MNIQELEIVVDNYLSEHTIYDLFKCPSCGTSWPDHQSSCFYDHKKKYFNELRMIASSMEKYKSVFEMAKRNGYQEVDRTANGIYLPTDSGILK